MVVTHLHIINYNLVCTLKLNDLPMIRKSTDQQVHSILPQRLVAVHIPIYLTLRGHYVSIYALNIMVIKKLKKIISIHLTNLHPKPR